jgi:N-acetylneuraminate synthase
MGRQPTFITAEIGICHNGNLETALQMMAVAKDCGCSAVKFQKRDLASCYTAEELAQPRPGPWGATNGDLKRQLEFGRDEYDEIHAVCDKVGIGWCASAWDVPSVEFLSSYRPAYLKIPSARLTDDGLLSAARELWGREGTQVILSTGMSTMEEVVHAGQVLGPSLAYVLHCTSSYPAPLEELNLSCLHTLRDLYKSWEHVKIGYSSHSVSPWPALCAVAMGAEMVEVHVTLDRATEYYSDHAASLEPEALSKLIREIRDFETAYGDGVKRLMPSEVAVRKKLRREHEQEHLST